MKPPMTLDAVESAIALYRGFPTLIPSPAAPPKKLRHAGEALLHVLQKRSLSSPVLLFDGSCCVVAIGYTTFPKQNLSEGLLYLMAYYYMMHLTYPKCVATLLSVIQTEILQDAIHKRDATASYQRAMAEWMDFIGKSVAQDNKCLSGVFYVPPSFSGCHCSKVCHVMFTFFCGRKCWLSTAAL